MASSTPWRSARSPSRAPARPRHARRRAAGGGLMDGWATPPAGPAPVRRTVSSAARAGILAPEAPAPPRCCWLTPRSSLEPVPLVYLAAPLSLLSVALGSCWPEMAGREPLPLGDRPDRCSPTGDAVGSMRLADSDS
jgi:hypothetical protein